MSPLVLESTVLHQSSKYTDVSKMDQSESHYFVKPKLKEIPKKTFETKPPETEHHTFTKPELRSINKGKTSHGSSDQGGHTFENPVLSGAHCGTPKIEKVTTGTFDKPALKSLSGSLELLKKENTDCAKSGFEKPALKPVERPEDMGMENQKISWRVTLRKTENQPVEDEKPHSSEPEWSQAARNKAAKALEIIQSKENQERKDAEKPTVPFVDLDILRKMRKSYPHQETKTDVEKMLISQTGQKGPISSGKDSEIVRDARSRRPSSGTGHPKSSELCLQMGEERTPRNLSQQAPSPHCSADSGPIPETFRPASFEPKRFLRGFEGGHRHSSIFTRSLSVPDLNKFSSERVQQEFIAWPNQISQKHPIQETTSLETEFPHYKMNARPRGICLIISNRDFKKEDLSTRHGTEIDLVKLKDIFTRLHFLVIVRENLDGSDMIRELVDISRGDHTHYDCFVCCILSHGTQDTVYGIDGTPVEISRLTSMVQPIMCRTLAEKPKLFFIQACQGLQKDEGIEIEVDAGIYKGSMALIPNSADFLLGYATVCGCVSFRVPDEGAWYISKLVDMLNKYHKCMDLLSILTKVNDEVSKMEVVIDGIRLKQMPSKCSTLRRKLVFK